MLVSIIIPCYNVEKYINDSIESALNQDYENIEILCVDNNSSDSTFQILKEFESRYPQKIKVIQELQKGASIARNTGFENSLGKWIQFLDADDLLLKNKISHQMNLVNTMDNCCFIAGGFKRRSLNGNEQPVLPDQKDSFKALFISKLGITSANLFNRKMIEEVGGWNPNLKSSQEADLMFRILKINSNVKFDESLNTIIRERSEGQISQLNPGKNWIQFLDLRLVLLAFLKEKHAAYFNKEKDYFYQNLFILLRILYKYDKKTAITVFNQQFEKNFIPTTNSRKNAYSFLFNCFGFEKTEQLRSMLSKK